MTVRASVLDLGSNSFHVLVADVDGHGTVVPVLREREMLHLGAVVATHDGRLPDHAVAQARDVVRRLTELARRAGTEEHLAVATSALRDAVNGPEVVAQLAEVAGSEIRVLDGLDEARLSYRGVRASVAIAEEPVLVLDLGGGSLELAIGTRDRIDWTATTDLGVSRLSAAVAHDPPSEDEVVTLRATVRAQIEPLLAEVSRHAPAQVISVGGTVRALARVVAVDAHDWLPRSLNQYDLETTALDRWADELLRLDLDTRLGLDGLKSRRADRIHLAALVVSEVLDLLDVRRTTVSDWGLREGVLLDALDRPGPADAGDLRATATARLRRTFVPDGDAHAHVAMLAGQLFDATAPLHGRGPDDRELLVHAATVHDVGEALTLRKHHQHGAYIVEHAEMRGFSPHELAVIASLVRFHLSRKPSTRYAPFASLSPPGRQRVEALLPLLQLAAALDRPRDGAVASVAARIGDDVVELSVPSGAVTETEMARAMASFQRVHGRRVEVVPAVP